MRKLTFFIFSILSFVSLCHAKVNVCPQIDVYELTGKTSYFITFGGYDSYIDPTLGYVRGESQLDFDLKATIGLRPICWTV